MQLQFKFNPSFSRVLAPGDRRLWLLRSVALRIEKHANPLWRFEIYHRRLLAALGALAVAGWLLAVTGLYLWLNRAPHNQVGWFDLAAPWRWTGLRAKRGDTAILTAFDELKSGDYPSAFYNLRVGLARSPGNVEGRLMLARLMAGHDPARAVAWLEEGLPSSADNPKLIGGLVSLYSVFQMHSHGLDVVEKLLQHGNGKPLGRDAQFALERARTGLLLQLGRPTEAEAALAAATALRDAPADLAPLQVEMQLRLGRPAEARAILDRLLAAPTVPPGIWRLAVEGAVAGEDADALTSALRHLRAETPESPAPYLLAFQSWHRLKRPSLRDAAEQEYYRLFRNNDGAMQALAATAVILDMPDVVARAEGVARAARLNPFAFQVHRTELALRRGRVEEATRLLRGWENNVDTLKAAQRFHPEFIKRLTRATFAGTPDQVGFLVAHLTAARGAASLAIYQLAADALERAGNLTGAAEVLRAGLQVYPHSDPLLVTQKRLDESLADSARNAATSSAAQRGLSSLPPTATEARRLLEEYLAKDELTAARDLARAIRAQKPAWLPSMETQLAVREVELAYLALDQLASRAAARSYLDRHRGEAELLELVPVAGRLAARGDLAGARLLTDEIKAAPSVTAKVQLAIRQLNIADDARVLATQSETIASFDRHIRASEWAEADGLLKKLRDNPPAWLGTASADIKVREVQIRLGMDQRPLALAALKELVIKSGAPRGAAFKLVRDFSNRGESEFAVVLAREIGRLLPGDPAAARLLQEAESPRPAGP